MADEKVKPLYEAFVVVEREGQQPYWQKVGAAFLAKNGKGLNVVLQALPVGGRLYLGPPPDPGEAKQSTS